MALVKPNWQTRKTQEFEVELMLVGAVGKRVEGNHNVGRVNPSHLRPPLWTKLLVKKKKEEKKIGENSKWKRWEKGRGCCH